VERLTIDEVREVEMAKLLVLRGEFGVWNFSFPAAAAFSGRGFRRVRQWLATIGFEPFTWPSWPGRVVYARAVADIDWLP
jgi:hypothetical protein